MTGTIRAAGSAGLGLLLALAVVEVFLRLSGAVLPSFVRDDERFGRVLRPDMSLLFVNEGFFLGRTNAWGYLGPGPGPGPDRPDGELRVALLGDSFVEGFQILDRRHFRSRLEAALNADASRPVRVMNFGFSGFNFARAADYADAYVSRFDPDLVLFFAGIDDFVQESTDLGPRFRAEGDSVVVDLSFRESAAFRRKLAVSAARDFSFYTLLRKCVQLVKEGKTGLLVLEKLHPAHGAPQAETDWAGSDADAPDPAKDAVNRRLLGKLGRWNDSGHPRVAIVAKRPLSGRYREWIEEAGLPILDPQPALRASRERGVDPNWWPVTKRRGHWNDTGHEIIARELAAPVRALLDGGGELAAAGAP